MKNLILFFLTFSISGVLMAQQFEVTPKGLFNANDNAKNYLVIQEHGKTAIQLYQEAYQFCSDNHLKIDSLDNDYAEGKYLTIYIHKKNFTKLKSKALETTYNANYQIYLTFNDESVKYELKDLKIRSSNTNIPLSWKAKNIMDIFAIYNKKGVLKYPTTKRSIEYKLNTQLASIKSYWEDNVK